MGALVDDQALDLVEHRGVGLVGVAPIGAARDDHPDRRLLGQHGAHLHRRGMGAQQQPRAVGLGVEEEGVVHLAGRMALGEIELGEIQVVGLDVGTFRDRETHVGEDRGELVHHLADRMHAADLGEALAHRQGDVERLGVEALIERRGLEELAARRNRGADLILEAVDERPLLLALVRAHGAQRLEQRGDRSALAERRDPHRLERTFVAGRRDVGQELFFQRLQVGHFQFGHGRPRRSH